MKMKKFSKLDFQLEKEIRQYLSDIDISRKVIIIRDNKFTIRIGYWERVPSSLEDEFMNKFGLDIFDDYNKYYYFKAYE